MKKTQVWGWYISSFLKKHKRLMFVGLLLGFVLSIGIIWILPLIPRPNNVKRIGLIGQFSKDQLPIPIRSKVSQGLTATLEDGSVAPMLSERWNISGDGKEYTFYLRKNMVWQDGTPLTTKDLEFPFTDVEISKKDDYTISFKLTSDKSFAPFPLLLTQPVFKKKLVGTGEYLIKNIQESNGLVKSIRLEHGLETLLFKTYPTVNMAKMAFIMGEVDEIHELNSNPFENDEVWKNAIDVSQSINTTSHVALFFNLENELFKDNKALRQALAYATRKPRDETRATGPISRTNWAYNGEVKLYDYEPKRANELAEKSFGNIEKVRDMEIKISTMASLLPVAEEIKKDWQEVFGCKVETEVINTIDKNYQVLLISQEIPIDPDQYAFWHSTQAWPQNIVNLRNLRIDKLLEEGRTEIDSKRREEIYDEFQKYFVEELPVLFLYYPNSYTIVRKNKVKNAVVDLMQAGRKTAGQEDKNN